MSDLLERLHGHIVQLCKQDRAPHTAGYRNSQDYLRSQIRQMGLAVEEHDFRVWGLGYCTNIYTEAGDPTKPRILIGAHYESRDVSGPGADDNASAVAATLETLRALKDQKEFSLTAVFFDMEENWKWSSLRGSRAFARWYSKPVSKAIILDLVGGALTPEFEPTYLQFGAALPQLEHAHLEFLHMPMKVLEPLGSLSARSDYDEYRKMKIPFSFFSSGTPWYYHTPFDTLEILRFKKLKDFTEALIQSMKTHAHSKPSEPNWMNYSKFIQKFAENPILSSEKIRKALEKKSPPSRWEIIKLYMEILPKIRDLGPDLWDDQTAPMSVKRP